jgi:protein-S-isoprenylcysteine O-methyltransferase Ste14
MRLLRSLRDPWVWAQVGLLVGVGAGAPLLGRAVGAGWHDLSPDMASLQPWRRSGVLILLLGGGVAVWGVTSLGANLTPSVVPLEGSSLVESGAYGWVRHPIYTGLVLALTGYALLFAGPLPALIVCAVAFGFFRAKARAEEELLIWRFRGYAGYARRVPAMLPRLRGR